MLRNNMGLQGKHLVMRLMRSLSTACLRLFMEEKGDKRLCSVEMYGFTINVTASNRESDIENDRKHKPAFC